MIRRWRSHLVLAQVPAASEFQASENVVPELRDVNAAQGLGVHEGRLTRLVAGLRPDAPRLADWLSDTAAETLACHALPRDDVRLKLRSTNGLERHHLEVRRRTRVIRVFPHEASLQRLLTALAIEQNDRWRSQRSLVAPTFLAEERPMQRTA